jgi:hypothetical protein
MQKKILLIGSLFIIFIFLIFVTKYLLDIRHEENNMLDFDIKSVVQYALNQYVEESGDYDLKFGKKNTIKDIDKILVLLQSKIIINNHVFGPYLNNVNSPNEPQANNYRLTNNQEYRITVSKKHKTIEIRSDKNDSVNIIEN